MEKKTHDELFLDTIVLNFNEELSKWEDSSGMRANFGFRYKEDGHKEMYVLDSDEAKEAPPIDMIVKVGGIMADAPTQVIDGDAN